MLKKKEHVINVNVSEGSSDKIYWIKIHKNNQYIPYEKYSYGNKNSSTTTSSQIKDSNEWHIVQTKKKLPKPRMAEPIYYWVVDEHNLSDLSDKSYRLFFTEPDTTQIENIDQNNYMAIDKNKELRLIHVHLKHKGMKMTPTYYIARNIKQIEEALHYVKYCVIKIENNEQKLVEI